MCFNRKHIIDRILYNVNEFTRFITKIELELIHSSIIKWIFISGRRKFVGLKWKNQFTFQSTQKWSHFVIPFLISIIYQSRSFPVESQKYQNKQQPKASAQAFCSFLNWENQQNEIISIVSQWKSTVILVVNALSPREMPKLKAFQMKFIKFHWKLFSNIERSKSISKSCEHFRCNTVITIQMKRAFEAIKLKMFEMNTNL